MFFTFSPGINNELTRGIVVHTQLKHIFSEILTIQLNLYYVHCAHIISSALIFDAPIIALICDDDAQCEILKFFLVKLFELLEQYIFQENIDSMK